MVQLADMAVLANFATTAAVQNVHDRFNIMDKEEIR